MNHPLVSIITVCFNAKDTIERTIEHVLNQTYDNIEYIIVDGESTDGTIDVAKRYISSFNGRLKFVSERDNGIYDAMNKGIKMASGELIGISNADDWLEYDAVEKIVSCFEASKKYQVVYGSVRSWYHGKMETNTIIYNGALKNGRCMAHPGMFVTKSIYDSFGKYDLQYRIAADYEFMQRVNSNPHVEFVPVEATVANYTLGGTSSSPLTALEHTRIAYKYNLISKKEYKWKAMKFYLKQRNLRELFNTIRE